MCVDDRVCGEDTFTMEDLMETFAAAFTKEKLATMFNLCLDSMIPEGRRTSMLNAAASRCDSSPAACLGLNPPGPGWP